MADIDKEFQDGVKLMGAINSFWNLVFAEQTLVRQHMDDVAALQRQSFLNLTEAINAISKDTVPVFHEETWYPLIVRQSEVLRLAESYVQFEASTDLEYGDGTTHGQPASTTADVYPIPLPPTLRDIASVHDRIMLPQLSLVADTDFSIDHDRQVLLLNVNLFADPYVQTRDIVDEQGLVIDKEILVWASTAKFDWNYVWTHFGYVLGLLWSSSDAYKALVRCVWDSRVLGGLTCAGLRTLVSGLTGIPVVIEQQETVTAIEVDPTSFEYLITTDAHEYTAAPGSELTCWVGKVVRAGDPLTTGIQIAELNSSNRTVPAWLPVLPAGHLLVNGVDQQVLLPNEEVEVRHLGYDPGSGRALADFDVYGNARAIERYWAAVRERESMQLSVARLLDIRGPEAATEPGPASLRPTINPAQWMVDNVLGNSLMAMKIRVSDVLVPTALSTDELLVRLRIIRSLLVPHTHILIFFEYGVSEPYYGLDTAEHEANTEISVLDESPVADVYDLSAADHFVFARPVAGTCAL